MILPQSEIAADTLLKMKTRTNSKHLQLKQSTSTDPWTSISELLGDVGVDEDVIIEILLRLPVKSLSKFKCVSKSWLCLITSPHFIRSHFSTSNSRGEDHSQILFHSFPIGFKKFSLFSALYDPSVFVSDIPYPPHHPLGIIDIVHGLVCLFGLDDLFLWNPVLRMSKRFSHPDIHLNSKGFKCDAFGFGYDASNDDYIVVFVRSNDEHEVMVYSLKKDSWRRIEDPVLPFRGYGKYANGKIHWIVRSSSDHEMKIVSLDMVSEKYGELKRPDYETAGVSCWVLGVLRGQLSVLCDYDKRKGDLWVMDKYGVDESWSKLVSIPYGNVHPVTSYFSPRVFCILRNGVVVLSTGTDSLLVYHSEENEFRKIELGGTHNFNFHVYVESLVSPAGFVKC